MSYLNSSFGRTVKKAALGLAFSSLASVALAWSISGTVSNEAGAALADVDISSFNNGSLSAKSDNLGKFSLSSDGTTSIQGLLTQKYGVQYQGTMLSITNNYASSFKVTLIDAIGKTAFQQEYNTQNVLINLQKHSNQKVMILRVSSINGSENYILTKNGATKAILTKEGELTPVISFNKAGYQSYTYMMKAETETDVSIVMKAAQAQPASSAATATSSAATAPASSAATATSSAATTPASSASHVSADVDCSGKTGIEGTEITVDGRKVIVHVPAAYDGKKPVPMIVDYHPVYSNAGSHASTALYEKTTDSEGVIILYPDGGTIGHDASITLAKSAAEPAASMMDGEWGGFGGGMGGGMGGGFGGFGGGDQHAWNVGPCCATTDDVTFSRHFIEEIQKKLCIDPTRIYATGFSMGGGMSNVAACKMADIYAAVAPASMDLSDELANQGQYGGCNPVRPISVLNFRGKGDNVVPYAGGPDSKINNLTITFLGAEKNLEYWAKKNGCSATAKQEGECKIYTDCKDGVQVGLCTYENGGHDYAKPDIAWNFLKQFKLP